MAKTKKKAKYQRSFKPKKSKSKAKRKPRSIFDAYNRAQLRNLAEREVDLEIGKATNPLVAQRGTFEADRARNLAEIQGLFSSLQPYVSGSAERMGQFSEQARGDERRIFEAAQQRLGALSQERAAEAQGLAQTLGAEIPVEGFTEPVEGAESELAGLSASDQLASIGGAGADVAAAENFAGRVFPMIRGEQEKEVRHQFSTAINELNTEIAHIKSQRGKAIEARFADRLIAEREFALQKLQANRDFQVARQTLGLERGALTGKYKGKPTLAAKQLKEQSRQFNIGSRQEAQRWAAEYNLRVAQMAQQARGATTASRAQNLEQRSQAFGLATALMSPREPKTYRVSEWVEVGAGTPGAVRRGNEYYKFQTISKPVPQGKPVRSPLDLYRQLISNGIPRGMARKVTNTRFGHQFINKQGKLTGRNPSTRGPGRKGKGGKGPAGHQ